MVSWPITLYLDRIDVNLEYLVLRERQSKEDIGFGGPFGKGNDPFLAPGVLARSFHVMIILRIIENI